MMFRLVRFLPNICDIVNLCCFYRFVFEIFATVYFELFIIWTFKPMFVSDVGSMFGHNCFPEFLLDEQNLICPLLYFHIMSNCFSFRNSIIKRLKLRLMCVYIYIYIYIYIYTIFSKKRCLFLVFWNKFIEITITNLFLLKQFDCSLSISMTWKSS